MVNVKNLGRNLLGLFAFPPITGLTLFGITTAAYLSNYSPVDYRPLETNKRYFSVDRRDDTHIVAHMPPFSEEHYFDRNGDGYVDDIVRRSLVGVRYPVAVVHTAHYTREDSPELFAKADERFGKVRGRD